MAAFIPLEPSNTLEYIKLMNIAIHDEGDPEKQRAVFAHITSCLRLAEKLKLTNKLFRIGEYLRKVASKRSNLDRLYHATYAPFLESIMSKGLGATTRTLWEDSIPGVVYLAIDPDIAESYAETADIEEDLFDQIMILEINTSFLDPEKLKIDQNIIDNQGDTLEYHGIIPPEAISIYKRSN